MKISKNERVEHDNIFRYSEESNAYIFCEKVSARELREKMIKKEIESERKSLKKDKDYIAFKKRQKL